jgi:hypothetical protein
MGKGDGVRRWGKAMGQGEAQACVSRRHKTVRSVCAKALVLGFQALPWQTAEAPCWLRSRANPILTIP